MFKLDVMLDVHSHRGCPLLRDFSVGKCRRSNTSVLPFLFFHCTTHSHRCCSKTNFALRMPSRILLCLHRWRHPVKVFISFFIFTKGGGGDALYRGAPHTGWATTTDVAAYSSMVVSRRRRLLRLKIPMMSSYTLAGTEIS